MPSRKQHWPNSKGCRSRCPACTQQAIVFKAKKPAEAGFFDIDRELLQVLANQASHFEHGDLGFAENGLEFVVRIDGAAVGRILQVVLFDVNPHFADHFGAWQWG